MITPLPVSPTGVEQPLRRFIYIPLHVLPTRKTSSSVETCKNPSSREMVVDKTRSSRLRLYQLGKGQNVIRNLKRHSDGTFTSDFTHYLDKMKAKDFVEWLRSTKRQGTKDSSSAERTGCCRSFHRSHIVLNS
ncbi:uncharacterized protein V6R79_011736 [Siganus canaliculatus]